MTEPNSLQEFNDLLIESLRKKWRVREPYRVIDEAGRTSVHWALDDDEAILKHLLHFSNPDGFLYLSEEPIVSRINELNLHSKDQPAICEDIVCIKQDILDMLDEMMRCGAIEECSKLDEERTR